MDLPLPPPPPFFRRPDHRDTRYANFIHTCDLQSSSFPHHLPPPPPPPPPHPHMLFPPPPPPHLPYRSVSHRFAFSPPHHSIPERAYPHEFDPPPKPYLEGNAIPFPPLRDSLPFDRDYLARSPIFSDEVYYRESTDNFFDRSPLSMSGRTTGRSSKVPDVGASERFISSCRGPSSYNEWDDDERRWYNGINYRGSKFEDERDYAANRCDTRFNNQGHTWYTEWVDDERRWDYGVNAQGYELHHFRNDDKRIQDYSSNDRGCEFYSECDAYQRRQGYGITDHSFELYNERDVLGFDRFSGRLGRRVSNEDFSRDSKKRRVQKTRALDRIELEKACKKRRRGNRFQHASKETNSKRVRGEKEKEVFKRLETRKEDKKEREQSPLELAISFESNGLVARAISTPSSSSPAGKSNMDLTPNNDSVKLNINGCSPASKFSVDMVKSDILNHGLDTHFDAHGTSESNASESRRLTTNENDIGENAMGNVNLEDLIAEGANNIGSGPTHICRLKKKKAKRRPVYTIPEEHLEPSTVSDKRIGTTNFPSELGAPAAANETLGDMTSQGTNHFRYWRARSRRLRKMMRARKKSLHGSNLEKTNDSGKITNDNILAPSGATEHDTNVFLSETDEVPYAVLLPSIVAAVSKKVDHDSDFSNSESKRSNLMTLPASPQLADGVIAKYPCHTEVLVSVTKNADFECQSGNDEVSRYANETILDGGNIGGGLVLNKHSDDVNMCVRNSDNTSFCTNRHVDFMHCSVLEMAENVTICSDVGSADAYSEEFAVADCSNVNLATLENSPFLSVEHKGISAEFNNSAIDTMIEQPREDEADLSHTNGFVEGFLEATETSTDHSPKFSRKRTTSYDQIDHSGPKTNEHLSTVSFFNGEVGKILSKDCSSSEPIDFPCKRNSCEENDSSSEGPSEDADLNLDVDGSSCKKKKVDSSGLTPTYIDDLYSDQSEVDWADPVLPDWEAGQWKDAHTDAATAIDRCGATDTDIKVEEEKISIADMDNIPSHEEKEKLHLNDDLAFVKNLSPDNNVGCNVNSGDELIESDSDELSCPSSPEDLLLFSDFSSPMNSTKLSPSQSRNGMIYGTGRTFNRRSVSAERLGKATSNSALTNRAIASPVTYPMVQKSNFTHGKMMLSKNQPTTSTAFKAFPGHPQKFNTSRTLPSAQVTKSKTWHRTGSVAVSTPKLQPSLPPQVHATKMSRPSPNSYVRKGNSLMRTPSPSSVPSPGFHASSSSVYRASTSSIDGLKKVQASKSIVDAPSLQRKPSPSSAISPGFHALSSSVYRLSPSTYGFKKGQTLKNRVDDNVPSSLQRKPSPSSVTAPGFNALRSSVYRLSPSIDGLRKGQTSKSLPVNTSVRPETLSIGHIGKSPNSTTCNLGEPVPVADSTVNGCSGNLDILHETMKFCAIPECQNGSDSQSTLGDGNSGKKITYVKRRSNQLVAASDSEDASTSAIDKTRPSLSDGYYKSKKNQLVRTSLENRSTRRDAIVDVNSRFGSQVFPPESSRKRQLGKDKGFPKTFKSSKFSLVWKLHEDAQSSEKHKISERPQKVFSRLFPWKRATYRRSFMLALGSKPNNKTFSTISQKLLLSRKRGAVYTRSSHGYSLRMSKVLSVGGSSLKWSKSLEKNSVKANEDATRAVAAAEKKKGNIAGAIISKTRNRVSRKLVPNVKLHPGERVFRIGSERYKMDPTRRTLHRITAEEKPSTSSPLPSEKDAKLSYVPRRLFIGSNEYVRIGNGNQLVRDPKKRTRVLASEKVRWSLRTARLRWAKKKKYCQFFTKFGKCNKEDGKCPYIHDETKIVVCTKFLNDSCSNPDCKLTHKVIPERMQDCSYFLKGSCSNENCPYRHVNVDPDSPVCESFLRGYCADGNECRKKHTYVCPAFEATGICPQASTCKLHHPKKKTEKKPATEEKIVRGRYFDGGLITDYGMGMDASERVSEKGKDENQEGKFPDFISLDVTGDEMEHDVITTSLGR